MYSTAVNGSDAHFGAPGQVCGVTGNGYGNGVDPSTLNAPGVAAPDLMESTCEAESTTCRSVSPASTPKAGHPTLDVTKRTATDPGPDACAIAAPTALLVKDRCATDNAFIDDCDAIRA